MSKIYISNNLGRVGNKVKIAGYRGGRICRRTQISASGSRSDGKSVSSIVPKPKVSLKRK